MSMRKNECDECIGRREVVLAGVTAPIWVPQAARSLAAQIAPSEPTPTESKPTVITVVYENNPGREDLMAQWGFACVIQGPEKTILFDTGGAGWVLLANMRTLNLDPKQIDAVVLSHIHSDHAGGLPSFSTQRTDIPVYMPVGFPAEFKSHTRSLGFELVEAEESKTICPGVLTTGTLGRGAIEEHGLCVNTAEGWVLITGCAHPGVTNLAARVKEITGGPIHLAMGGYHMPQEPKETIVAVMDRFEELGVIRSAPCHCSGEGARRRFKHRFKERCDLIGIGHVFTFGKA
ncbi:MAG: MBL fold metallo-hydrolase [Phycisphaerales bacterium]|nr:MAG: MBL fold metallo-hydrolase [Phycisphaerales bacterium]